MLCSKKSMTESMYINTSLQQVLMLMWTLAGLVVLLCFLTLRIRWPWFQLCFHHVVQYHLLCSK